MFIERERQRSDQTSKLGKDLSGREAECYQLIFQHGVTPFPTKEIYKELFGNPKMNKADSKTINSNVATIIHSIRQKLGNEAIINKIGFGYITRRQLINYMVANQLYTRQNNEQE